MNRFTEYGLKAAVAGIALMAGGALANPVVVPTQVSIADYSGSVNAKYWNNGGSYGGRGGAWSMTVYDQNGDVMDTLVAFCLEVNESIRLSAGDIRYNLSMDDYAADGGRGGQTSVNRDPLSDESAWLYLQVASTDASGNHDGAYGNAALWGDVQHALWMLEDEIDGDVHLQYILGKQYENGDPDAHHASVSDMIAAAREAVNNGWSNSEGIVVYNLWSGSVGNGPSQSMLAFKLPSAGDQPPVPEPAVLLLMGGGLLGFAGMRKRNDKR